MSLAPTSAPWVLRRRVSVLVLVSAVVTLVLVATGWYSFARLLDARSDLIDRVDPAALASRDLFNAYIDQETGVRGFAITGDPSFLDPYREGSAAGDEALDRLRDRTAGMSVAATVSEVVDQGERWRSTVAEPTIAAAGTDPAVARQLVEAGKASFDAVRSTFEDLDGQLGAARRTSRADLDRATQALIVVLSVLAVGLVAMGAIIWLALLRWVVRPLVELGEETRVVAEGNLEHAIVPSGPAELVALGVAADAMRLRIVTELQVANAAQAELDVQARELARSNAELEQFAYVASHDLQEPLRKVASFCELLRRRYSGQLDERADQYIDFAVDGAKRMQVLINDLLAFSRVGRVGDGLSPVDCDEVVATALHHSSMVIEETGAQVIVGPLPTVAGDRSLLVMLFKNLIENSIKFRGEATPRIEIDAQPYDLSADLSGELPGDPSGAAGWLFTLRDNGIGIQPEYRDKVFVIFQRLHSREQYPGTGIGLAMCRKIVEHHGGRIWIEDGRSAEAGQDGGQGQPGTTFRWTLAAQEEPVP